MADLSKIAFLSSLNFMKRGDDLVSSTNVTLPSIGNTVTHTVTHNLGYIPFVTVGSETDGDGIIWANDKVHEYTETSLTGTTPTVIELVYWPTTTTLTIGLINHTGASGTRTIHWAIYLDYGNE